MILNPDPDNPQDWDPNHPLLTSPEAPHETGAVLRMHRAGFPAAWVVKNMKIPAHKLQQLFKRDLDAEDEAHRRGVPIYSGETRKKIIPVRDLEAERKQKKKEEEE